MARGWMTLAIVAALWGTTRAAEAQLSVGGHVGYGAGLNAHPDPYRALVGARVGWNFEKIYLGANVNFFGGEKFSDRRDTASFRQVQVLGLEAGYDVELGPVVLRPLFGLGGVVGIAKVAGRKENQGAAFVNFGAEALTVVKEVVFLGGGLRFISSFYDQNNINAFSFYGLAGVYLDVLHRKDDTKVSGE